MEASPVALEATDQSVHANGIDIHYVEAGQGEPLVLLHGGMVSTSPVWAGSPVAYVDHMDAFAKQFRVIAPDVRGCGKTINPDGGPISYAQLADDAHGLIDALGLERPLICGFSDGAMIATILGIRSPGSGRAIAGHAGYDLLNPQAPSFAMARQVFGGSANATEVDPAAAERFFEASDELTALLAGMRAEHDEQGAGSWKTVVSDLFDRISQPPGHTFEDLRAITAPTLILAGDRDMFCSVEEGAVAYRLLDRGELAILPDHGHMISPAAVALSIDFLRRHAEL
jgi:pimeloyl-ACP methyl ester carboxylesterase